ncbi:hypothetical protein F4779DRAFT_574378 [Xylariaceae sp. FL0662B]|nr:hypothetical protein F4779DRAFT_574378 [Xylariaceae sp. FL0662B]
MAFLSIDSHGWLGIHYLAVLSISCSRSNPANCNASALFKNNPYAPNIVYVMVGYLPSVSFYCNVSIAKSGNSG